MYVGTLPGPTPSAGFPELYAARTRPVPPVARIMEVNRCRINSSVACVVGALRHPIEPSGAPAFRAASYITRAVSRMQRTADGCGLITMAFRALRAMRILKMAVEVGLVVGIMAATTPAGT